VGVKEKKRPIAREPEARPEKVIGIQEITMKHSLTIVGSTTALRSTSDSSAYAKKERPSAGYRTAHNERAELARKKVRPH
jgi:hypothetical protein